jgi:AraC-like DNA-binding protein
MIIIYWTDAYKIAEATSMAFEVRETLSLSTHCAAGGASSPASGVGRPAFRTAREYIETHFAENVSISKLAALVSLSPYHFARTFGREIGLPPHTYLESVRIRKAREFLDQGHALVHAALSAGYVDQSHFTRRFKKFLGITPGRYVRRRKSAR